MPLPSPNLDDRRFQDLVDDAKRLVQQRCPEWTDHNVSDPGVTLIETVASMVDQLLYRLNRVPAANYVRFLDLLDIRLFPPTAAHCELTFWLSAELPHPVAVPAGTPVATPRTETEEPVVVTTVDDLAVVPCRLAHLATSIGVQQPVDRTERWGHREAVTAFGETPAPGDAILFGLSDAVPGCAVLLRLDCEPTGANVDPRHPPLAWEAWDGARWLPCEVDRDETGGLNRPGDVVVHVPAGHAVGALRRDRAGWLRCRATDPAPGQPFYTASPRVRGAAASTIGGTVAAVHAETVHDEVLGISEGVPGQRFTLRHRPAVPGGPPLQLVVGTGPDAEEWTATDHFGAAGTTDPVFVMDWSAGEVVLGPVVRREDGTLRQYGRVPPKGAPLRLRSYRCGGGRRGNVAQGLLRVPRDPVPFVTGVENRRAATGGVDGETIENAAARGPLELRTAHRAVTVEDYELLAGQVAPEVARVRCLRATDGDATGGARVLVVPRVPADDTGRVRFEDLMPGRDTVAAIGQELDRRRCVGARVVVEPPYYQGVTVGAIVQARERSAPDLVKGRALDALYGFLHPVTGGPDGTGWPFGRPVQSGEVFSVLQSLPDVEMVEEIELYSADPTTGERSAEPTNRIDLRSQSLVFSFAHSVRVTAAR